MIEDEKEVQSYTQSLHEIALYNFN